MLCLAPLHAWSMRSGIPTPPPCPAAHLLCHRGVRDDHEALRPEAEPKDLPVCQEQLVQRHEDRLPHNLPHVAARLRHPLGGGPLPNPRLTRKAQRQRPACSVHKAAETYVCCVARAVAAPARVAAPAGGRQAAPHCCIWRDTGNALISARGCRESESASVPPRHACRQRRSYKASMQQMHTW